MAGVGYLVDKSDAHSWGGRAAENLVTNAAMVGVGADLGGLAARSAKEVGLIGKQDSVWSSPAISREWARPPPAWNGGACGAGARQPGPVGANAVIGHITCADPPSTCGQLRPRIRSSWRYTPAPG